MPNPSIEMEFEYAYNCWKSQKQFDDETAKSLKVCMNRTSGSEIDKAANAYPVSFLNYIDKRIREV